MCRDFGTLFETYCRNFSENFRTFRQVSCVLEQKTCELCIILHAKRINFAQIALFRQTQKVQFVLSNTQWSGVCNFWLEKDFALKFSGRFKLIVIRRWTMRLRRNRLGLSTKKRTEARGVALFQKTPNSVGTGAISPGRDEQSQK